MSAESHDKYCRYKNDYGIQLRYGWDEDNSMVEAGEQDRKRYEDTHVKYKLDSHNMPSLTAKQRAEVAALVAQTDK